MEEAARRKDKRKPFSDLTNLVPKPLDSFSGSNRKSLAGSSVLSDSSIGSSKFITADFQNPTPSPSTNSATATDLYIYAEVKDKLTYIHRDAMGGGTEAFPDLGMHCQNPDCNQLDFLPFKCDGCLKVFCTEHRSYKSHECPNSDHNSRRVVVCEKCSTSIEITRNSRGDEESVLAKHEKSGDCDPKKKKKPTCAVRRCKEILTFSNTSTCKSCDVKFCLRHRFPADHACKNSHQSPAVGLPGGGVGSKFLAALASRNGQDCTKKERGSVSKPNSSSPSVKAY